MRILVIDGSPRKGNTWKVVRLIEKEMKRRNSNIKFHELTLSDLKLPLCCGCSNCFRTGHKSCPHNKQVQMVLDELEACDGFIFAASCYQGALPAISKNLTDHLAFLLHRPRYFKKKALAISTTGGVSAGCVTKSIANTVAGWGVNHCAKLPIVAFSWNDYKPTKKQRRKIRKVATEFYDEVASRKLHPVKIGPMIPFNLFRAMSKDYMPGSEYPTEDGVFWQQYQGMVYAKGIPIPVYKRVFGWLLYWVGRQVSQKRIVSYKKN